MNINYNFRNIHNTYKKCSILTYDEDENYEEYDGNEENYETFTITSHHREVILTNEKHHQSIIFHEYRNNDESKLGDVCDIANYINDKAYTYLCNVLNTTDSVTVFWSQIFGTTSDYTIIYDSYFTDGEECRNYLKQNYDYCSYKYVEILGNECRKCF